MDLFYLAYGLNPLKAVMKANQDFAYNLVADRYAQIITRAVLSMAEPVAK